MKLLQRVVAFCTSSAGRSSAGGVRPAGSGWGQALWSRVRAHGAPRKLRLCESLALGERRFVAVIEFENERFLLGGTATSLALLSRLGDPGSRAEGPEESPGPFRRWNR
jgi:hypothetical protein